MRARPTEPDARPQPGTPPAGTAPADTRPRPPGELDRRGGDAERRGDADRRDDGDRRRDREAEGRFRRIDDLSRDREERRENGRTIITEPGGRTIIRDQGGRTIIRRDEALRFREGPGEHRTERRGSETVTIIERPGGVRILTYVDDSGRLIRRARRGPDGREVVIIDNRSRGPGRRDDYFVDLPPPAIQIPRERYIVEDEADYDTVYETLTAPPVERLQRRYSLDEIRYSPAVRDRMPRVDLDTITFETGSWQIPGDQTQQLAVIARAIKQAVSRNPNEVFLIEGHTDAVGSDDDNLSLSDRRAESVAVTLQDSFQVPPENLTTQGYGEQQLKVKTDAAERRNRRVTIRRITPLLSGGDAAAAPAPARRR